MTALWQFAGGFGVLLGSAAGVLALALPASIANRWFTRRRGLAMGILTAAFAAGQLAFMPTNAWLATHYGWRTALLAVAIGCALCVVLYVLFGRDWPADLGVAPYGESNVQRPALGSAGNAIALSFSILGEAVTTRVFWILAGTFFTHTSVIKTTFLLYFATPAGMMASCDATGAVSIIGRWKPFV